MKDEPQRIADIDLPLKKYDVLLRFYASENALFWTRSQLFLVANAALLGFALNALPESPTRIHWPRLIIYCSALFCGVLLCALWNAAMKVSDTRRLHWRSILRELEAEAFGNSHIIRRLDSGWIRSTTIAMLTVWVFMSIWVSLFVYGMALVVMKYHGYDFPQ